MAQPHRLIGPAGDLSSLLAKLQPGRNKTLGNAAKPRRLVGLAKDTTLFADFNQSATDEE